MTALRALMLACLALFPAISTADAEQDRMLAFWRGRIAMVSGESLRASVAKIASFGSRLAGSKGERQTLEWAEANFRTLGLQGVRRETFRVTVPDPDARASVAGDGWDVEAWPLWPNVARTSTCDVRGPLVYGGTGTLEDLSGKEIKGSVVVLEFNSGSNWRNAAKLGASAVLFVEPRETTRAQAEAKFAGVPLSTPRFWVPIRDAGPLLNSAFRDEVVRVKCRQDWIVREAYNLIAELPGSDPELNGEPILFSAHADAMSVVPGMAYGGESSCGLAALMEIARISKEVPGKRRAVFLVTAAHGVAMQGAREFVERRLARDSWNLLLAVSLDLSSGSGTLGSFDQGWFYDYRGEAWSTVRDMSRVFRAHAELLAPIFGAPHPRLVLTDAVNDSDGRTWKNDMPGKFAFECETFTQARYNAITLATIEDSRARFDTPFDTARRVNIGNLVALTKTLSCLSGNLLNDTSEAGAVSSFRVPLDPVKPQRMSLVGGFATVHGRVVQFDPVKSFLPDVSVPGTLAIAMHRQKSLMGVRPAMVQMVEGEGSEYRFIGLPPSSTWFYRDQKPSRLTAIRQDPNSGHIDIAASNSYLEGTGGDHGFMLTTVDKSMPIVVFPCVATDLYDLVDPHELNVLTGGAVLSADGDAEPNNFGLYWFDQDTRLVSETEDAAVLLVKPGYRWKLLMGSMTAGRNRVVLLNGTPDKPNGSGYLPAQSQAFDRLPYHSAKDIINLNRDRIGRFSKYKIIGEGIQDLQAHAEEELKLAREAYDKRQWASGDRHSRNAWGYALSTYPLVRGTVDDVVIGVVFYLFLLIPFSYFIERLVFASRSLLRQLLMAMAVFFVSFGFLRLVHPAFEIVSNPTMIFVAFVMGALSLVVTGFVVGKFEASLKSLKALQSGVHEVDIGRVSVAMAAFNLGISNMRRRKARTALTTLTLVVMTFIVLSFTSIVSDLRVMDTPSDAKPRYPGILVRQPGLEPLQIAGYRLLANLFQGTGTVVRRAWYYGADIRDTSALTVRRADRLVEARAVLGMDAEESEVTRPQEALLPGGRWFLPGERNAMLLPRSVAEQLKIDASEVGKTEVRFAGEQYRVIGILEDNLFKALSDLDGDGMAPADFALSTKFQTQNRSIGEAFRKYLRLDPGVVFVIPADDALRLGADLRTVAVRFPSFEDTKKALDDLMPRVRMNLYAAVPGESEPNVRMFSTRQGSKNTGLGLVLVQMLIAAVFVFGTMAAGVYERTKEIGVLSAVGLAPNHIAVLFFAESLVYGVMGAVLGYFVAQGVSKVILMTGVLPGLYLNFSATSAVLSAVVVIAVVLLSTIYPARVAARIAAPALDEDMMSEPPEGDVWSVTLPFSVTRAEAWGLSQFLLEWLRAYEEYTIGDFVTSGTELLEGRGSKGEGRRNGGTEGPADDESAPQTSDPRPSTLDLHPSTFGIRTTVWIAPYDLGVSQLLELQAHPTAHEGVYRLDLVLTRQSGDPENWVLVNKRFLDHLRQQFLTWRTLAEEERARYQEDEAGPVPAMA